MGDFDGSMYREYWNALYNIAAKRFSEISNKLYQRWVEVVLRYKDNCWENGEDVENSFSFPRSFSQLFNNVSMFSHKLHRKRNKCTAWQLLGFTLAFRNVAAFYRNYYINKRAARIAITVIINFLSFFMENRLHFYCYN